MAQSLVMHIDDALWSYGGADRPDEFGDQLIGDREKGPWILVVSLPPGHVIAPHRHNADQVRYIINGEITTDGRIHGPGTVYYTDRRTDYSFIAGPEGVRYLAAFSGPTGYKSPGKEERITS